MSPPDRSKEQRLTALEKANAIRFRRAQLKRDIKAQRVELAPLIADPPEWLLSMRVIDLLMALPRVGRVKASVYINRTMISSVKTVGGLSRRQREALCSVLARG